MSKHERMRTQHRNPARWRSLTAPAYRRPDVLCTECGLPIFRGYIGEHLRCDRVIQKRLDDEAMAAKRARRGSPPAR